MASIRKAKKEAKKKGVVFKAPDSRTKKIRQETRDIVEKVNKRLKSLEKSNNYYSYASKKLFDRLDTNTIKALEKSRSGHVLSVKINRDMTNTQLLAIQKASKQFLVSSTSTSKGIEKVRENTKKSMLETLKEDGRDISTEDIDNYYDMLSNSDFDYFSSKIGASSMWAFIDDAIEYNYSEDKFLDMINKHMVSIDENNREIARRLYQKYIL